jgi:predicted NACHT family NTPase
VPFYYPLTLGIRQSKPIDGNSDKLPVHQSYETWREGLARFEYIYEEFAEVQVLTQLQQRGPWRRNWLWLILGEPGAGKTTLLEAWFTRWATQLATARLGLVVPVLVRLRSVQAEQTPQDSEEFADQLWALGLSEQALLERQGESIYRRDRGRCFQPVWLLDGLDELRPPPGEQFYQALVNLPGLKVVSCRTAVYEIFRREVDRYKEREYELLGLKSSDQHVFLTQSLNGDSRRAKVLHDRLQHNSQLRLLAGNPLMLSLIAQVSDHIELPATQSEFYKVGVSELWRRRLARHPDAYLRTRERDEVLTELAERMGMAQIEAPLAWLEEATSRVANPESRLLIEYLLDAGLVRLHPWEQVDFVHLTFEGCFMSRALPSSLPP